MKKDVLSEFATKHDLRLTTQECGFGEIVTGFIPRKGHMFLSIDKNLANTKPSNAYSHCDILAIKGSGIQAKQELTNWINQINKLGLELRKYENQGNERQIQETGKTKYMLSIIE